MKHNNTAGGLLRAGLCLAAFCAVRLAADVVETTNGARIVGKITMIHGGTVTVSTDFAGDIKIKQSLVTSITTDRAVAVRVADGTRYVGIVAPSPGGGLAITSPKGSFVTPMDKVVESWAAADEDPDVVARRRKWTYEAGVDINGRSGTQSQMGEAANFGAKLAGPDDTLKVYTNYVRQETDSQVSADQFKAGIDYADNFTPVSSWYARDEGGFDRVNDISFYDVAAAGYGYDFVKQKDQTFTGRAGLSYRYEEYSAADSPALSSTGADFELEYTKNFKKAHLHDKIAFVPAFKDLSNYLITHDISYEIPITKSLWKLAIGMSNNFESRPVDNVGRLETLYYTRLVLSWGQVPAP